MKQYFYKNKNQNINLEQIQFSEIKNKKQNKEFFKYEKRIQNEFHGNRDLYNIIKGVATEAKKLNEFEAKGIVSIIERYIERNFGGIEYEISIDIKKFEINLY